MSDNKNSATGETQLLDSTTVEQVDVNLDEIFGNPGAESIMLPSSGKEEEKPKNLFSKENVDTTFLDSKPSSLAQREEAAEKKSRC